MAEPETKPVVPTGRRTPRAPRRWLRTLVGFVVVASPLAVAGYLALQSPEFYVERLRTTDEKKVEELANQFLSRGTRLYNSIITGSNVWKERFDEASINAWLACDLKRNHRKALPKGLAEPRVALEDDHLRVAFQYGFGPATTVVQIALKTWVPKPNQLAVELQGASAGKLPLSTTYVRSIVEVVAERSGCQVRWKRNGPNLVALITLPASSRGIVLRRAEVAEGGITLSGQTLITIGRKESSGTMR